ncbi:MAG: glycosyltransferase [Actinobacteria bacterium]|nr:glycosyltransferase [Actinomycetota bacterium]
MRIALYSPYLDTLGGGEKYMMTIAEVFSPGNSVDVLLDKHLFSLGADLLKNQLLNRFNLNLKTVNFIYAPIGKSSSSVSRAFFLKKYDVFFYLTDGSIFFPSAKKNILHLQSPLVGEVKSLWRKIKLSNWDLIIYNSGFTKEYSQNHWPVKSEIIYPPVDTDKIKPLEKKKYILSVGRFFGYLKDKKHAILIKAFKDLFESKQIKGWSLHLVGSAGKGDEDYLAELEISAKGLPVNFYPNLDYNNLVKLYGQSSIYWHASGFGETDPAKMEHFGISTVEAMAGGCVPVVIAKGGQKEIVQHTQSGYLWDSLDDLKKFTLKLAGDDNLREEFLKQAMKRAQIFNKENFKEKILKSIKFK